MPNEYRVQTEEADGGLRWSAEGAVANAAVLASCLNFVGEGAREHGCLSDGLALNSRCVQDFASIVSATRCLSQGFGLIRSNVEGAKAGGGACCEAVDRATVQQSADFVADRELLTECVSAVYSSLEKHGALTPRGILVSEGLVEDLVAHANETGCLDKAFGLRV